MIGSETVNVVAKMQPFNVSRAGHSPQAENLNNTDVLAIASNR